MSARADPPPSQRRIRTRAMQWLYQYDLRDGEGEPADDEEAEAAVDEAARPLAEAAWADRAELDRLLAAAAPQWPPGRQPVVDRAILRLAAHEMRTGRCPAPAAINEAVELAKAFGGAESPRFVNGVLDRVARELGADPGSDDGAGTAAPEAPEAE